MPPPHLRNGRMKHHIFVLGCKWVCLKKKVHPNWVLFVEKERIKVLQRPSQDSQQKLWSPSHTAFSWPSFTPCPAHPPFPWPTHQLSPGPAYQVHHWSPGMGNSSLYNNNLLVEGSPCARQDQSRLCSQPELC